MCCGGPAVPGAIVSSTSPRRWWVWLPSSRIRMLTGPAEMVSAVPRSTTSTCMRRPRFPRLDSGADGVVDWGDGRLDFEWQVGLDVRVEPGGVGLLAVPDLADQPA